MRKKQINITTMEIGIRKYMRQHPLFGTDFKSQERITKILKEPKRYRKEGSYISR